MSGRGRGSRSDAGPGSGPGRHTIVLIQTSQHLESRTFSDHNSVDEAVGHLLTYFEERRREKQGKAEVTYDSTELLRWVDGFTDISFLVFDRNLKAYVPFDRTWIKDKLYLYLQRLQRR